MSIDTNHKNTIDRCYNRFFYDLVSYIIYNCDDDDKCIWDAMEEHNVKECKVNSFCDVLEFLRPVDNFDEFDDFEESEKIEITKETEIAWSALRNFLKTSKKFKVELIKLRFTYEGKIKIGSSLDEIIDGILEILRIEYPF
jgi:hypothetical protein